MCDVSLPYLHVALQVCTHLLALVPGLPCCTRLLQHRQIGKTLLQLEDVHLTYLWLKSV